MEYGASQKDAHIISTMFQGSQGQTLPSAIIRAMMIEPFNVYQRNDLY